MKRYSVVGGIPVIDSTGYYVFYTEAAAIERERNALKDELIVVMRERNDAMIAADNARVDREVAYACMTTFCERVERGEVRSIKTYNQFNEIMKREPVSDAKQV